MRRHMEHNRQSGFSLIEMLMVVLILSIVMAIVIKDIVKLQQVTMDQNTRVDQTQEARAFIDQITLDLHQSGYPSEHMFGANPCINVLPCFKEANGFNPPGAAGTNPIYPVVNGIEYVDAQTVQFEGDIDGSGQVSEVYINLQFPPGQVTCTQQNPCTLRRGVLSKALAMAGAQPAYFTELTGVVNNPPNIFAARDSGGNVIALPQNNPNNLGTIRSIDITIVVQSQSQAFPGQYPLTTLNSGAKVNSILN